MLKWIKNLFKVERFNIGDKVRFSITTELVMRNNAAWCTAPGNRFVMYGPFEQPGEKYVIDAVVSSISDTGIFIEFDNWLPGYKEGRMRHKVDILISTRHVTKI